MADCSKTTKEAAAEMLAKHRAARAEKTKEAFKKVELAKKAGRVLFKAKTTSIAKLEGNLTARLSLVCWIPALPYQ
jgi:hypothetical protein